MDRHAIIATLRARRRELAALGVAPAALFGSRARNEASGDGGMDVLIGFAPGRAPDIHTFVGLQQRIADLLPVRVDVVDQGGLRPSMRAAVERDIIGEF